MQRFRIGVFGCDANGKAFAKNFMRQNCDIVAACDTFTDKKDSFLKIVDKGCTWYDAFDAFINHPMDAVVLTNIFPENIHYAIRCLEKGIHVFSESPASSTMARMIPTTAASTIRIFLKLTFAVMNIMQIPPVRLYSTLCSR